MMAGENLYLRNGVYWIRYNVNGRKVRQSLGTKSLRVAKRLKTEILANRDGADDVRARFGLAAAPAGGPVPTFGEVADRQLLALESQDDPPVDATMAIYRGILNGWLRDRFGHRPLSSITRDDVRTLIRDMRVQGIKDSQRAQVFRRLRAVYLYARRESIYTGADPSDIDKPPTGGKPRDVALTPEQMGKVLAELEKLGQAEPYQRRLAVMAELQWFTGLRWGEVNGLAWEDIDLEAGRLQCVRSYRSGGLKSEASGAPVLLPKALVSSLRAWKLTTPGRWVFPRRGGKPLAIASSSDAEHLADAGKAAGIPFKVTSHVMRHSFGTAFYQETKDPVATQQAMRHANIRTTLAVYVKPYDDDARRVQIEQMPAPVRKGRRLRSV